MHLRSENEFWSNTDQNNEFKDAIVLEPVPLAFLSPKPVIPDEEFEKEIDLMMMDYGSMDAEPSSSHDLV
ncbi:hypothetical protein MKX03_001021, partial [Papaver bracteatum]